MHACVAALTVACGPTVAGSPSDDSETSAATAATTDTTQGEPDTGTLDPVPDLGSDPAIAHVVTGGGKTCIITTDGDTRCWGTSKIDPVLIGDDEPARAASVANFGRPAVAVATGFDSCALLDDGTVTCWGINPFAVHGVGDEDSHFPPPTAAVSLGGAATAVEVGLGTACARLDGGIVRCWGLNDTGLLGHGAGLNQSGGCDPRVPSACIGDDELPSDWPPVDFGGVAESISVGVETACALTPEGRVRAWGREGYHGIPFAPTIGDDEVPSVVPDVDVGGIAQAVACGGISCALLVDGLVSCWSGLPYAGHGIDEPVGDDETPASVGPIALPGLSRAISADTYHACAIVEGGELYCWGLNTLGQLGLGHTRTVGDDETPLDAGPVDLGGPVREVSAGGSTTCAILESGDLYCWGGNANGIAGYGFTEEIGDDETPASVGPVPWR